jgi:adenylate kinase
MTRARATRAVFLGAPGAGKGTQAKMLSSAHGVLHVSSGDMLREHRRAGSELGRRAQEFMDRGELVPDDLIIEMVMARIAEPDAAEGWILDGFPRTLPQAQSLDRSLHAADSGPGGLSHVVYFDVPHEILVRRLTGRRTCSNGACGAIWHLEFSPPRADGKCAACGSDLVQRPDDRAEVVERRLAAYRSQTEPLLDYYASRQLLVRLHAAQSPEAVFAELVAHLGISQS